MSNAEQRLNANREVRKLHPVMATRSFSPLSPILKRMSSQENTTEEETENKWVNRIIHAPKLKWDLCQCNVENNDWETSHKKIIADYCNNNYYNYNI